VNQLSTTTKDQTTHGHGGVPAVPPGRVYVGIDVGYREHVAVAIPLATFLAPRRKDQWQRAAPLSFSNDSAGFRRLLAYLKKASTSPDDFLVLLEPTGGFYGLNLQYFLVSEGYPLLQVENRAVKDYREKVFGSQTKTDEVDARLMARMGFLHEVVHEEFTLQPIRLSDPGPQNLRVMVGIW
jgi:transposase